MSLLQTHYLFEVEQQLVDCPKGAKTKLLNGLNQEVEDFVHKMPDCALEDLIELFGEPEYVARQLLDAVPLKDRKAIQQRKNIVIAAAIAILCGIILEMGVLLWKGNQVAGERIFESIYVSQPYFGPDDPLEKGF